MVKILPTMLKDTLYITDSAVIFVSVRALNHYFFFFCDEIGAELSIFLT
jgi:hypothetical protein